jgi:predicted ATPase
LHELGAEGYAAALAEHRQIVRAACLRHEGVEVDTQGDAFFFAFPTAPGALAAADEMTEALASGQIQIRIGLHTGAPLLTDEGYIGEDVHFGARVAASSHGGQVVLSSATAKLVELPLSDLGEHRLKDIPDAVSIYQLGDGSFPPLKTISNTNLPRPASSFVGRDDELQEVLSRIGVGARLVTLTGPGGTGKTRLALEAAATLVPEYKAGVFWVGLASLRDPALVTGTISQTLGAKNGLAEHIGERELLLLLDNLEQVIEAAPELASLLSACPNLTLLVTSRELLRVQGEVEYPVPPLAEPEAVSLFCERAQLEPSEEIAELCARLDNLPLPVELAAARAKALSPAEILERLSGRLDLLRGGRDADPRQQTLRATIEWSYDLLAPAEERLFARLSVFAGGCTLEAAEQVAGADLDTVQSLVEKSLLRYSNDRYWMLETIREYATERLEHSREQIELRQRHARFIQQLATRAEPELEGPEQGTWLDVLEEEADNIRSALAYLRDTHQTYAQLELVGSLQYFWYMLGNSVEGRRWSEAALAGGNVKPTIARAKALNALAGFTEKLGDPRATKAAAQEALVLSRELGYARGETAALTALSLASRLEGDYPAAATLLEQAAGSARASGDLSSLADATASLAFLAMEGSDPARAIALAEEARASYRQLGDRAGDAYALTIIANCLLHSGRRKEGFEAMTEALPTLRELGFAAVLAGALGMVAAALGEGGKADAGATLMGAEDLLRERVSLPRTGGYVELHGAAVDELRLRLGDERYESAFAAGRAMSLDDAVEYALSSIN